MPRLELEAAFRRDGVLLLRRFFDLGAVRRLRDALDRYRREKLPSLPDADYTLEPDGKTVRNLWRLERHDAFFREFAESGPLADFVAPLVAGAPTVMGVESFDKPARVGTAVPPHQDNAYFCLEPPDVLTAWIPVDEATLANGAVQYLPGSHRKLLPHVPSGVKGNSFALADAPELDWDAAFIGAVSPGDVLIHHGQTVHRSGPNTSGRPRTSLAIVYRGAHTRTDQRLKKAYEAALSITPQNG